MYDKYKIKLQYTKAVITYCTTMHLVFELVYCTSSVRRIPKTNDSVNMITLLQFLINTLMTKK